MNPAQAMLFFSALLFASALASYSALNNSSHVIDVEVTSARRKIYLALTDYYIPGIAKIILGYVGIVDFKVPSKIVCFGNEHLGITPQRTAL